jgi:sulfhydrogenase subunit beta (sulfur reductase)
MSSPDLTKVTRPIFQTSVRRMMEENKIFGVQKKSPGYIFDNLWSAQDLCLDYNISVLPPNKYVLPSREPLIEFNLATKESTEFNINGKPSIILGIHPYDLHAFKILDSVYAGYASTVIDTNYLNRRKQTAIIGVDCFNPWPYSFSASMGTAMPPDMFDLWLTDLGDDYLIEIGSIKGNGLLKRYFEVESANESDIDQRKKLRQKSLKRYKLSLDISPQEVPRVLDLAWDNPIWDELGKKCFSCGSCTMVCPTCVCYNVKDTVEVNLQMGGRYRQWDSCMFFGFATVSGGENFRPTGTERLRHRLHRKGKYMLERWGELGCVGCGRCVHACLVDIASPVYAYNRLAKEVKK